MATGGIRITEKLIELVAVCPLAVTVIVPVVAPVGTDVVMLVAVLAVTDAAVPLNLTPLFAGVVSKFVPVIVIDVPTPPVVGVKLVIVGAAVTVSGMPMMGGGRRGAGGLGGPHPIPFRQ